MAIETEIKAELPDYPSYLQIYHCLGLPDLHLSQENIYIDTADQKLLALGVMFRLRIENGENIFTVKSGGSNVNGVQKSTEQELSVVSVDWSVDSLQKILKGLCVLEIPAGLELIKIGSILNNRVVFSDFFGAELELDHMQIFDKHFFEIEVETSDVDFHKKKIEELLKQNNLEYIASSSKYGRFLMLLKSR